MMTPRALVFAFALALWLPTTGFAEEKAPPQHFELADVFQLEWITDPRISPDGKTIVAARRSMDIQSDRRRGELWIYDVENGSGRPLVTEGNPGSPRFSPDGKRLLYVAADENGGAQIFVRWFDDGSTARLSQLPDSPGNLTFSPDGRHIAFSMFVPQKSEPPVSMPEKPEGAEWADPPLYIEQMVYRADGQGYVEPGSSQLFVLPAEGGTPRQLTSGPWDHDSRIAWLPDSSGLIFAANRRPDHELEPFDSEIFELTLADGNLRALTDRRGPDSSPTLSPDGHWLAYLGFDDRYQGYQVTRLYVLDRRTGDVRCLTEKLDRSAGTPVWDASGQGVFFQYADRGNGKIAHVDLSGQVEEVTGNLGGTSLGRPYGGGTFTVSNDDRIAFNHTQPDHPADLAVVSRGQKAKRLTRLNDDLFGHKELGAVEEIWFNSSHDDRALQGWIVKPPGFDKNRKYPLVLEIHGGPFEDYGDRFSAEVQLFAAAGNVVLYMNPRGSTSYGEEFGNLIHHAYPGDDFHDLMSGVDAVLERGFVDPERLYVTGGSGGGVLTAWIVGHTDRFRAAVVAKPVIHWTSFALTADAYNFFYKYWFPGPPWEHHEHYWKRSPLSRVGHVKTPTMLLTGELDYRTPIAESEQFFQALRLRQVPTAMVRIPGASHGIANRPSQLIAKVAHILGWFERHGGRPVD